MTVSPLDVTKKSSTDVKIPGYHEKLIVALITDSSPRLKVYIFQLLNMSEKVDQVV